MKRAILLALLLGGCVSQQERDMAMAQDTCRRSPPSPGYTHSQCVADNYQAYRTISNYSFPTPQAAPSAVYYPSQVSAIPTTDAPPLPNILPPTVRCQSVNAGLGTVQTICR